MWDESRCPYMQNADIVFVNTRNTHTHLNLVYISIEWKEKWVTTIQEETCY